MTDITNTLVTVICSVIIAAGGFVVAWLKHREAQLLKRDKEKLNSEIKHLHNGFRES